jgi:hypothetical protein
VKRGPTELISGLFLEGGPLRSSPHCRSGTPSPGTITVSNPTTGAVIARDSVANRQLATIPLAPGTLHHPGTFGNAFANGQAMNTQPRQITITAGYTVRADVVVNIPWAACPDHGLVGDQSRPKVAKQMEGKPQKSATRPKWLKG